MKFIQGIDEMLSYISTEYVLKGSNFVKSFSIHELGGHDRTFGKL